MGRFKAGDRVKILAGHPYWIGNDDAGVETEGVYVTKEDRGWRGKHIVKVDAGAGAVIELAFKGRELEPLAAAEWVPKVGDRVRRVRHTGTISNCRIGHETTITRLLSHGRGFWYEGEDGSEQNSSRLDDWEVISSFTIEAGKFYRTRDGRKVGPMRHSNRASFEEGANGESYPYYADGYTYTDAGRCHWNPKEDHRSDLVAEWVDEPEDLEAVEAEVRELLRATPEPAAPPAKFKVGDRVDLYRDGEPVECWRNLVITEVGRDGVFEYNTDVGLLCNARELKPTAHTSPATTPQAESFIVARLTDNGQPRPNARPRVHTTLAAAEQEAQRLADRLGDEFAVYQRVSSKTVDAGPVPTRWGMPFDAALAKGWVRYGKGEHPKANTAGLAFEWKKTKQGFSFWSDQCSALTPLGRAILRKWIAEAESTPAKEAA